MKLEYTFVMVLGVLSLGACANIQTESSYAPGVAFDEYRTYRIEGRSSLPKALAEQVESSLQQALSTKGLSSSPRPELLVNFFTLVEDDARITQMPTNVYVPYRRGYAVWTAYETSIREVTEGSLFVDVVDIKTNQMIWEGNAHGAVSRGNPDRTKSRITAAVEKMLRNFPPSN